MKPSDEFDLKDANRKKNVDIEDIREINSMNASGQSRTDRIVSREFIDDNQEETPSDGESESEETESRDGDRDAFSQRKEEKTIDYYKLPKGKARDQCTDWTVINVKIVECMCRLELHTVYSMCKLFNESYYKSVNFHVFLTNLSVLMKNK